MTHIMFYNGFLDLPRCVILFPGLVLLLLSGDFVLESFPIDSYSPFCFSSPQCVQGPIATVRTLLDRSTRDGESSPFYSVVASLRSHCKMPPTKMLSAACGASLRRLIRQRLFAGRSVADGQRGHQFLADRLAARGIKLQATAPGEAPNFSEQPLGLARMPSEVHGEVKIVQVSGKGGGGGCGGVGE